MSDSVEYGYAGPGVYRILNRFSSKALADDDPSFPSTVAISRDCADVNDQKWVIANINKGMVLFINNGTGKLLMAAPGIRFTPCYATVVVCNRVDLLHVDKGPVSIESVYLSGGSLDLEDDGVKAGTTIMANPSKDPNDPTNNLSQAWDLEYLGPV
ncbi:MAG: hypothetical protein Q9221_008833 [Calogaya cf. arnoldii]